MYTAPDINGKYMISESDQNGDLWWGEFDVVQILTYISIRKLDLGKLIVDRMMESKSYRYSGNTTNLEKLKLLLNTTFINGEFCDPRFCFEAVMESKNYLEFLYDWELLKVFLEWRHNELFVDIRPYLGRILVIYAVIHTKGFTCDSILKEKLESFIGWSTPSNDKFDLKEELLDIYILKLFTSQAPSSAVIMEFLFDNTDITPYNLGNLDLNTLNLSCLELIAKWRGDNGNFYDFSNLLFDYSLVNAELKFYSSWRGPNNEFIDLTKYQTRLLSDNIKEFNKIKLLLEWRVGDIFIDPRTNQKLLLEYACKRILLEPEYLNFLLAWRGPNGEFINIKDNNSKIVSNLMTKKWKNAQPSSFVKILEVLFSWRGPNKEFIDARFGNNTLFYHFFCKKLSPPILNCLQKWRGQNGESIDILNLSHRLYKHYDKDSLMKGEIYIDYKNWLAECAKPKYYNLLYCIKKFNISIPLDIRKLLWNRVIS